jgi:hypothetical protein
MIQPMTLIRSCLFVCLVALATGVAWAESDQAPQIEGERAPASRIVTPPSSQPQPSLPGRPSRFNRDGYGTPRAGLPPPEQGMPGRGFPPRRDLRDPRFAPSPAYGSRDRRLEALRSRYAMPSQISGDMHQAIEAAQREHGGKVLSADRLQTEGRDVYRVKLLTPSGRVRVVQLQQDDPPPSSVPDGQEGEN